MHTSEDHRTAEQHSEELPKQKRIADRRDFLRVYETGRKMVSRYTVVFFASNDHGHSRIGITATKKLGKANVRNRLKRWTREIYRRQRAALAFDERQLDIVVNIKSNAATSTFLLFSEDLLGVLTRIAREATR